MASAPFPNRPYALRLESWVVQQDIPNNRSLIGYQVWIDKVGFTGTQSAQGQADRFVYMDYSQLVASDTTRGFNFTAAGPWLVLQSQSWANHNPDGTRTLPVSVAATYDILGSTQVANVMVLPPIARNPPPAPLSLSVDQITRTSLRYNYISQGDGGSPIITFRAQISADNFATVLQSIDEFSGSPTFGGLRPGGQYWLRSFAINGAGSSPSSAVLSAFTLSGAYISNGATWAPADVLISDGISWKPAQVLISDGTKWNPAG